MESFREQHVKLYKNYQDKYSISFLTIKVLQKVMMEKTPISLQN